MSQSQGAQQKLEQLKAYIPFVERMISKLESRTNHDKGEHLEKLRSLHKFLTNPDSRLQNIEMLERMEKIIKGMYKSVGKVPSTNVPPQSRSSIEDSRLIESEKRRFSKERYPSDSHFSHWKHDRRDDRSRDTRDDKPRDSRGDRSSHRDHHSSRSRDSKDGRSRSRERERDRDRDHHRRSWERDNRHRNSSRDTHHQSGSRVNDYSKSRVKDSYQSQGKHEGIEETLSHASEKETVSKGGEVSSLKMREKELFGDDKDFMLDKNTGTSSSSSSSSSSSVSSMSTSSSSLSSSSFNSFSRDPVKGNRFLKQSLLDLPMPPVQKDSYVSLNSKAYLDIVDTKGKESLPKVQRSPVGQSVSSKVDLLKRKIGLLDDSPKPKYNFHEFKFNETSLGSLSLNEKEVPSLFPTYKEDSFKESSHLDSHKTAQKSPIQGSVLAKSPVSLPAQEPVPKMPSMPPPPSSRASSSSSTSMSSSLSRSITATLKTTDIPLPTYPHVPPTQSDTPQSPDHEASFSPHHNEDNSVKSISLEKEKNRPSPVSESSPLAQVNMEAIQKALNFINAHDKSKRSEPQNVSYRYEDFIGPATNSRSKSDYYNPEETWENVPPKESLGSMDEDLRKKDIDLRQIPGQFISRPPPPSSSHFQMQSKRSFPAPPALASAAPSKFSPIGSGNYSVNPPADSNWYSSHDNRRGPVHQPLRDAKDTDMRTLLSTGASQQSSSFVSSTSSKIPLSTPAPSEPPSSSSDMNKKKSERLDASSKKPEVSKLDSIRTRVAHDQDKLIKLGQKGVAASQLETYKQKREKYLANPTKPTPSKGLLSPPSESHTNVPLFTKTGSQSVLDALLPEPSSSDSKVKDVPSSKKDESAYNEPTCMRSQPPLLAKPSDKELSVKEPTHSDIYVKNKSSSTDGQKTAPQETAPPRNKDIPLPKGTPNPDVFVSRVPPLNKGDGLLPIPTRESLCNKPPFMPRSKSLDNSFPKFTKPLDNKNLKDPRTENPIAKDPRTDNIPRDPRSDMSRIPRVGNLPRDPRSDGSPRDPRSDNLPRSSWSDLPQRDPRSEKRTPRDPRSETFNSQDQRIQNSPLMPARRDPRLSQNEFSRDPRANVYPHGFPRDPRMGLLRDPSPQEFQPHPLYNTDTRWNPMGSVMRPSFPLMPPTIASVAPIPIAPVPPTHFKPGPSPKNSAIGQTFTCIMMQGLPHYANSSHIYRFFEEYLLSDICIELDQSYNCKGTAYIHFPTHSSAKAALEKENGKFMHDYKIYLRICSLGILSQAKRTHDLQNIDREKYLNIPPRPRGNGNPFYKKPKTPPPIIKEIPKSPPPTSPSEHVESKTASKEEESSKPGYSALCGVKIDSHGAKGLQSFKIPKLKKATSSEEATPSEEKVEDCPQATVASVSSKSSSNQDRDTRLASGSESDDLTVTALHTKKNRRYRKIVRGMDSDSESEKERVPAHKKVGSKLKKQRGRLSLETEDSGDEDSMIIDESVTAGSDQDSNLSDSGVQDVPEPKEDVFEKLFDSYKKEKPAPIRGRKKMIRTVKVSPKGSGRRMSSFKVKGGKVSSKKKIMRKGKARKTEIINIEKTKLTRQKHEILSPKKKLQVTIPTPFKLVYCLVTEDKITKRGPRKSRAPAVSISPVPSETSSNASVLPDVCEPLSLQESDVGAIQKLSDVSSYANTLSSDAEKELIKSTSDSESCHTEFKDDSNKRLPSLPLSKQTKRPKKSRNPWQKGYKRSGSPLPDIIVSDWKRCYSPPLNDYRNSSKTKRQFSESAKNQQEPSSLDIEPVSVFDSGVIDDTELPDLTQITPTITDKEMSIFTVLPDLSTIQGVIGSHITETDKDVPTSLALEETEEKRIKMISDDLVETANKFTEKESRQQSAHEMKNVADISSTQKVQKLAGSDDEEDSLSSKVNQLVASLDESFSNLQETSNPNAADHSTVTKPESSNYYQVLPGSSIPKKDSLNEGPMKEPWNFAAKNQMAGEQNMTDVDKMCDVQKEISENKVSDKQNESTESEILSCSLSEKVSSTDDISGKENLLLEKREESSLNNGSGETETSPAYQDSLASGNNQMQSKQLDKEEEKTRETPPFETIIEKGQPGEVKPLDNESQGSWEEQEGVTSLQERSILEPGTKQGLDVTAASECTVTQKPCIQSVNQREGEQGQKQQPEEKRTLDQPVKTAVHETPENSEAPVVEVNVSDFDKVIENGTLPSEKESPKLVQDGIPDLPSSTTAESKLTTETSSREREWLEGNAKSSPNVNSSALIECKTDKRSIETTTSSAADGGAESDVDDGASIGLASMSSFPDDTSVVSNEGREGGTPDPPSSQASARRSSKRDSKPLLSSGMIERRRITRGSMMVPQVDETILWDDGGIVDLFQCDQCDYVGKQRVSHLINFHTDRKVPCEFRKEDYNPVLRDALGPVQPANEVKKLNLSWLPKKMIFDVEIECRVKDCDYNTNSRFDFFYHILEHKPQAVGSVFHCRLCNFMSDDLMQFYDHVSSHTGEYRHTCVRCGQRAFCIEALVHHHKDYHGSQSQEFTSEDMILEEGFPYIHVCRACHHVQISLSRIEEHIQSKHNGKVDCVKANMSRHIVLHSDKKKETEVSTSVKRKESELGPLPKPPSKVPRRTSKPGPKVTKGNKKLKALKLKEKAKLSKFTNVQEDAKQPTDDDDDDDDDHDHDPVDTDQSTDAAVDQDQSNDAPVEKSTNVPVFLGQEELNETNEKAEEKEAEELVNRILLNNYTSRSSLEIKKKISTLDTILKKVDDDSQSASPPEESKEFVADEKSEPEPEPEPEAEQSKDADVSLKNTTTDDLEAVKDKQEEAEVERPDEMLPTPDKENIQEEKKIPEGGFLEDKGQPESIPPQKRRKKDGEGKVGEELERPLTGIISRLRTHLAEEDVLAKIKEKEKRMISPLSSSQPSDAADDSDSDHLVICEDEGDLASGPAAATTPTSEEVKHTLRVKPPHELFSQPQEQQQSEIKGRDPFKCRLGECLFAGSSNNIGAHGWTSHRLYMCIFPSCMFLTVSDKLYNLHFEMTHKIRKFGCPFRCAESNNMMSPSDMIKHIATEHGASLTKEKTFLSDVKEGYDSKETPAVSSPSNISIANFAAAVPSFPGLKNPTFVKKPETPVSLLLAPKQEDKSLPLRPKLKKELPDFPGTETLPMHPPTVPLLPLFTEFQSHRTFLLFTGSKAPEVFKCMTVGCSFVTDDSTEFESHSNSHFTSDYRCCYCFMRLNSGKTLVEHILTEHSHCPFQCKYCLYRAYTKVYLGVHLRKFHPDREPRYIKVGTLRSEPPPNPAIENFVHPYKCTFAQCTFRSVDTDAFKAHTAVHGPNVRMQCIFCEVVFDTEGLLKHMHVHMMNEYQCPYCLFGEAEREKLLTHLLNCHPGRPGKVLLRRQVSNSAPSGTKTVTASALPPPTLPPLRLHCPPTTATSTLSTPTPTTTVASCPSLPHLSSSTPTRTTTTILSTSHSGVASSVIVSGATTPLLSTAGPLSLIGVTPASVTSPSAEEQQKKAPEMAILPVLLSTSASPPITSSELTILEQTGLTGTALYRCGNEKCEYSCSTQLLLKEHLQVCDFSRDSPQLRCFHCSKNFRHLSGLLDHIKVHGPKRYLCGVESCDYRGTMSHYFKNHMKQIHHHSGYKIVLKDFSNKNPETQEFIVYPKEVVSSFKEPHKKRRNEYGVDDFDKIPRIHVSYQELKCYHCMYASKVRLNLIKHLKLHQKYPSGIPTTDSLQEMVKAIPSKQPVNPVPRLERKELMFDKMMNLAGSSFEDKKKTEENDLRLKYPIPLKELEGIPGFVPEEQLNSCGIDGCKYLSCDEMMLKCHIRTLHSDAECFPCPHCTDISLTLDKIGSHLKLHGETLYRCGWCPFLTPRKALVERHLTENHPLKIPFDFCIRGSDKEKDESEGNGRKGPAVYSERNDDITLAEPCVSEEASLHEKPVDGQASVGTSPNGNSANQEAQWQCGICPFRSVIQSEMVNHTSLKHAIKSQYKCGYCNVRSSVRTAFDNHFAAKHPDKAFRVLCMYYRLDSDDIEPLLPGGSTTSHEPLWRRNDPDRRKQIRGIYLDDDENEQELGFLRIHPGEPKGDEFVCPKCHSFKTPCISTFRSHLCKEANYQRFECAECGITNPLLPTLRRHYTKTHGSQFSSDCYITLPVENTLEDWVESIISHQQHMIKIWKENGGISSSPSKGAGRKSLHFETEEASGAVLHDSGSDKGKYVCPTCGVECRTGSGLKSHITAMHQTKFKCQLCPFSSNMELAIQNHRALKHPKHDGPEGTKIAPKLPPTTPEGELPLSEDDKKGVDKKVSKHDCSHCDFKTNTSRAYYAHLQTHVQYRSYVCHYCEKRFESQRDGNRHSHWKHPSVIPKIIYAPVEETGLAAEETESGDAKSEDPLTLGEAETKKSEGTDIADVKPATLCYSCCHCSLKGPYQFVEEHVKAQHRDLPFLLRKEEDRRMYLEMYKYRCGHCLKDSDSLMEAMDHWVKNHVTLDFKFSLSLFSSTVIKSESETSPAVSSGKEKQESVSETPSTSSGNILKPFSSSSKIKKGSTTSKPDSSSAPSAPSDLEDNTAEEELNESFSSDLVEGGTDGEIETNRVTSSTTEDKDVLVRCAYCRKVSKRQSDIYDHIRSVHPDKPMKVNLYQKGEYDRLFRGVFECDVCGEQGTTAEISKHIKIVHPGTKTKMKRIIRATQKDKICFRCDICAHVVKARKSIKAHMDRMHPGNSTSFTKMLSESNLLLSTKQPIKCNYCGDSAATIEEMESHHTFLHSHLPMSFTNLRDEALLSIHKSSSSIQPTKEPLSSSLSSPIPFHLPLPTPPLKEGSPLSTPPCPLKNKARKSFQTSFPPKRQIATKSTSGRLQLVRLRQVKEESVEEKEGKKNDKSIPVNKTGLPPASSSLTTTSSSSPPSLNNEAVGDSTLNLNEIYASVNLLGSTPMRLSVTQLSALVNLNPRIILKDIKENTVAALI